MSQARSLIDLKRYHLVWIEKEIVPWIPAWIERALAQLGTPYLVDFDDAIFHRYDLHRLHLVRGLLGKKIDAVMKGARTVVCGNRYLADRARSAGAENVALLPTVLDLTRYALREDDSARTLTIGWIGSPTTARFLRPLIPMLNDFKRRRGIRIVLMGTGQTLRDALAAFELRSWSESGEAAAIAEFDIGLMPLPDTPWSLGKCGYKLIQYMACGVPVVASAIGANLDIIDHGRHGFLVQDLDQWRRAISTLCEAPAERRKMGLAGRKRVERRYHTGVTTPRLATLLREAAEPSGS